MKKLLILADDLTGALDTGAQFASLGISVCVYTGIHGLPEPDFSACDVAVVHTESRHCEPSRARNIVKRAVQTALARQDCLIYKKTDSALRGNVGAELIAAGEAAGAPVFFVPAFPQMDRVTRGGVHYCAGVPVNESPFGKDPQNPVKFARVADILTANDPDARCVTVPETDLHWDGEADAPIICFDCSDTARMEAILDAHFSEMKVMAGCAGFASVLAEKLDYPRRAGTERTHFRGVFAICGSVNPASAAQVQYAVSHGFAEVSLTADDLTGETDGEKKELTAPYAVTHSLRAELSGYAPDRIRDMTGSYFASLLKDFFLRKDSRLPVVVGGDTLAAFIHESGCERVCPERLLSGGAVLCTLNLSTGDVPLVTKSGGFGDPEWLYELEEELQQ